MTDLSSGKSRYRWCAAGDLNAFFGLMLDNIAGMAVLVMLLTNVFGFPVEFALTHMIPGTAIGVLVGDLLFFWLAFRYAKATGKSDVTAMPLGLDTPSTIGMAILVLGPAFREAKKVAIEGGMSEEAAIQAAAMTSWQIGICAILITGIIKFVMAFGSNWLRNMFPRAGLLGSLAAIALVLIAFMQLPKLAGDSIVGFASLVIVFVTLIGRNKLPFRIPGALGAVLAGVVCWYLVIGIEKVSGMSILPGGPPETAPVWFPTEWLTAFQFEWLGAFGDTVKYLPYIVPFAIATVIGGIDCAESAASVGDDFNTGKVIGIEAVATILAALCGGVVQTTPYIGHPAYKAMGGRAAYTLATALFVGGAGLIGYFSVIFRFVPEVALLPILIFIGIEITAQSFHATPKRHYAALAVACLPAMAKLVTIYLGQYIPVMDFEGALKDGRINEGDMFFLQGQMTNLTVMAGGFILTSLIWGSAVARIIDRRFVDAAIYFSICGVFVLFGIVHSPLADDKMFLPWQLGNTDVFKSSEKSLVIQLTVAYFVMAAILVALDKFGDAKPIYSDEQFEQETGSHFDHDQPE